MKNKFSTHIKFIFVIIAAFGFLASCFKLKKNEGKSPVQMLLSINEAYAQKTEGLRITSKTGADITPHYMEIVNITASLQPIPGVANPTGTVIFTDGTKTLECQDTIGGKSPVVDNKATCRTAVTAAPTFTIMADYSGDDNFEGIDKTIAPSVLVSQTTTTFTVTVKERKPTFNMTVKNNNNVNDNVPGKVSALLADQTVLCEAELSANTGTCIAAASSLSKYAVLASFIGDNIHYESSKSNQQDVTARYKTNIEVNINQSTQQLKQQKQQLKRPQPQQQTPTLKTPH